MSYPQFGYPFPAMLSANPQLLMSMAAGSPSTPVSTAAAVAASKLAGSVAGSAPTSCCESGRPVMTDPHTGQTICSCQYTAGLLNYSRVAAGLPDGLYGSAAAAAAAAATAAAYAAQRIGTLAIDPSAFCSPIGSPYEMKENADLLRSLSHTGAYYPYDPATLGAFPYYANGFGMDPNMRRKNATRESTSTLKAWLSEHRKNPYPTKGEKIMLAIITKMTLTQVSTWFANARRRLKKDNKVTWSPRNRCGEDDDDDDDDAMEEILHMDSDGDNNNGSHVGDDDDDDVMLSVDSSRCEDDDGKTEEIRRRMSEDTVRPDRHLADRSVRDDRPVRTSSTSSTGSDGSARRIARDERVTDSGGRQSGIDLRTSPHPSTITPTPRIATATCAAATAVAPQTKPKIWSVADVVASSDSCSSRRRRTPPPSMPLGVAAHPTHPAFLPGGAWSSAATHAHHHHHPAYSFHRHHMPHLLSSAATLPTGAIANAVVSGGGGVFPRFSVAMAPTPVDARSPSNARLLQRSPPSDHTSPVEMKPASSSNPTSALYQSLIRRLKPVVVNSKVDDFVKA